MWPCFMYSRVNIHTVNLIERSFTFSSDLHRSLPLSISSQFIDPLSYDICCRVDRYTFPSIYILALTCLRFSDLEKIDLHSYFKGLAVSVFIGKTERAFILPRLPNGMVKEVSKIAIPDKPFVATYSSVRYMLNRIMRRDIRAVLGDHCGTAHVFRHLRASYLKSLEVPEEQIMRILGHKSKSSLSHYIHKPLIDIFITLQKGV